MSKCPCLIRKTSGVHYYGIKCLPKCRLNAEIKIPTIRGQDSSVRLGWTKERRDQHHRLHCTGNYNICEFYK